MSESDSNFFNRWSRRKAQVREGAAVPADLAPPRPMPAVARAQSETPASPATPHALASPGAAPAQPTQPQAEAAPLPTLADVDALTTESDYGRFVKRDVAPEVRQAALKKLFTDPHFNVMDGLDVYIDDYGKPDPLPEGMLRQMVQSHMLGLFDHEKEAEAADALPAALSEPPPDGALPEAPEQDALPTAGAEDAPPGPPPAAAAETNPEPKAFAAQGLDKLDPR